MKKYVSINEDMNEIRYYEKDIIDVDVDDHEYYLSTMFKYLYLCTKSDCDEEYSELESHLMLSNNSLTNIFQYVEFNLIPLGN